jgi:hypothetical protein
VPAQSGCTLVEPYPGSGCAAITAEDSANSKLHVQGTTYLPRSAIDVALNNSVGQAFSVGVVARSLRLAPTATADLSDPVIGVPIDLPAGRRTVVYLNVYVCPGSGTCSAAAGVNRLRAKVEILDRTGAPVPGNREITVYSWSVLR